MSFGQVPSLGGAKVRLEPEGKQANKGAWKIPFIGVGPWLAVYATNVAVALAALMRRVLYKYVKKTDTYEKRAVPSMDLVQARLGLFFSRTAKYVDQNVVKCSLENFPLYYSGGKRKVYQRAVESLARKAISWRDALVKGFVKVEPTQPGKDPRLIQTRDPRYHAMLGCFVRPAEKLIYRAVDKLFGSRTIVKGLNAGQIGVLISEKWNRFACPVAIGLDASRFDRSVSVPLLLMVHRLLLNIYYYDLELFDLLQMQLVNKGIIPCSDGFITYDVEGGIMSGDIDTSLKGCVIMCSLVWSWAKATGVVIELVDNGDDCVVFMEKRDQDRFLSGMVRWFSELGIDVTAEEPVYILEQVVFCQSRPVVGSAGTYVMCRDYYTASVKDSMTVVNLGDDVEYKRWLSSVAACGLALAGDMPVFSAMYGAYERAAGGSTDKGKAAGGLFWQSIGMSRRHGVSDETRLSFWLAFGIPPFAQVQIEDYYHQLRLPDKRSDPNEFLYPEKFSANKAICELSKSW